MPQYPVIHVSSVSLAFHGPCCVPVFTPQGSFPLAEEVEPGRYSSRREPRMMNRAGAVDMMLCNSQTEPALTTCFDARLLRLATSQSWSLTCRNTTGCNPRPRRPDVARCEIERLPAAV
ncbi:hypothetical protein [Candidatus Amarobacter glycogenicus]|uniref:hypothetical protein n=1 Tax=Candidatus Amarobacter glycogenicus TaxID=3140699 RepID=UPI002A0DD8B5|nr:hypothetical protein [Dehalococcoidia bacterium]